MTGLGGWWEKMDEIEQARLSYGGKRFPPLPEHLAQLCGGQPLVLRLQDGPHVVAVQQEGWIM